MTANGPVKGIRAMTDNWAAACQRTIARAAAIEVLG